MAITVKKIELWSVVVDNKPGALANLLEPLAEAGADLQVVMGTSMPGGDGQASIGVYPVKGRKVIAAARAAGLAPAASMPSLLVQGDNRAGLGGRMSEAIAGAGIDIGVAVALVAGEHFSALFGFANAADADKAAALLKKSGAAAARNAKAAAGKAAAASSKSRTPARKAGSKAAATKPRTAVAKAPVRQSPKPAAKKAKVAAKPASKRGAARRSR
jgi:hypothetical protein